MKRPRSVKTISKGDEPLAHIEWQDQIPLPPPYDKADSEPEFKALTDKARDEFVVLDDTIALNLPRPDSPEAEEKLVNSFLEGFRKCLTVEDNWTFLQPLMMSLEHCAKCNTCGDACHIYQESGKNPVYRPTCRSWRMSPRAVSSRPCWATARRR